MEDEQNAAQPKQLRTVFVGDRELPIHFIKENFVKVVQPFSIKLVFEDEAYIATSSLSDIYEVDASAGLAVSNYLYSLADELFWLQEHEENLSAPLLKQRDILRSYLSIV